MPTIYYQGPHDSVVHWLQIKFIKTKSLLICTNIPEKVLQIELGIQSQYLSDCSCSNQGRYWRNKTKNFFVNVSYNYK